MENVRQLLKHGSVHNVRQFLTNHTGSLPEDTLDFAPRFDKSLIEYILQKWPDLKISELMFVRSDNWEMLLHLYHRMGSNCSFTREDIYRNAKTLEHVRFYAKNGAPKELAAYWYAYEWDKIEILLEYCNSKDERQRVLHRAGQHLVSMYPNEGCGNWEICKTNFTKIVQAGLQNLYTLIEDGRGVDLVLECGILQDYQMCFAMLKAGHKAHLIKCLEWDEKKTMEMLLDHCRFEELARCYEHIHGNDWSNVIDPSIHHEIMGYGYPGAALKAGFKLFRSIAKLGYNRAAYLFEQFNPIEDLTDGWWVEQEQRLKERMNFPPLSGAELKMESEYRVIVFCSETEVKIDGFYYPETLYDIQGARVTRICTEDHYETVYDMIGTNDGPFLPKNRYEPNWTCQLNTFSIWGPTGKPPREFGTGRDGGCLNCGGLYYIRIIEK